MSENHQGELVGHIRKYDTRVQIEMLRAHIPDKFKTPGWTAVTEPTGLGEIFFRLT